MAPVPLQGDSSATSRLEKLFEPLIDRGLLHDAVGYILRVPVAGGHGIALLHPESIGVESSEDCAAILCDSLEPTPFGVAQADAQSLLIACALENVNLQQHDGNAHSTKWACFLVTGEGHPL